MQPHEPFAEGELHHSPGIAPAHVDHPQFGVEQSRLAGEHRVQLQSLLAVGTCRHQIGDAVSVRGPEEGYHVIVGQDRLAAAGGIDDRQRAIGGGPRRGALHHRNPVSARRVGEVGESGYVRQQPLIRTIEFARYQVGAVGGGGDVRHVAAVR